MNDVSSLHHTKYGGVSTLRPAYLGYPQAASSCNVGPQTITPLHRDSENLSYGICTVSALGQYDSSAGAELALLEPGVVVPLRRGKSIMFPSAMITHGNFPLSASPNQCRYSLTTYTSGSVFQWALNGGNMPSEPSSKRVKLDCGAGWDLYRRVQV